MRRTDKDRAIKRKQKQAAMAVKLNCRHSRRIPWNPAMPFEPKDNLTRLLCIDCGEVIVMAGVGVFGSSMDPKAKRNSVNTKHG